MAGNKFVIDLAEIADTKEFRDELLKHTRLMFGRHQTWGGGSERWKFNSPSIHSAIEKIVIGILRESAIDEAVVKKSAEKFVRAHLKDMKVSAAVKRGLKKKLDDAAQEYIDNMDQKTLNRLIAKKLSL